MEIKKHIDIMIILGGVLASVLWMNASVNSLKTDLKKDIEEFRKDINSLRNDITIVKTVLIMKDIMPVHLATKEDQVN
jgi:hypothetical protein